MSDFKAKMHQINFGWGSAPSYPLAGFNGPTSKAGEGGRGRGGKGTHSGLDPVPLLCLRIYAHGQKDQFL